MEEEKLICPECGTTTTKKEILEEISAIGSTGMCMCEYSAIDPDTGETWFPRTLIQYVPYNKHRIEQLEKKAKELVIKEFLENSDFETLIKMLPKKEQEEIIELYDKEEKERDWDYPYIGI